MWFSQAFQRKSCCTYRSATRIYSYSGAPPTLYRPGLSSNEGVASLISPPLSSIPAQLALVGDGEMLKGIPATSTDICKIDKLGLIYWMMMIVFSFFLVALPASLPISIFFVHPSWVFTFLLLVVSNKFPFFCSSPNVTFPLPNLLFRTDVFDDNDAFSRLFFQLIFSQIVGSRWGEQTAASPSCIRVGYNFIYQRFWTSPLLNDVRTKSPCESFLQQQQRLTSSEIMHALLETTQRAPTHL